jgi:hypothetical protein
MWCLRRSWSDLSSSDRLRIVPTAVQACLHPAPLKVQAPSLLPWVPQAPVLALAFPQAAHL